MGALLKMKKNNFRTPQFDVAYLNEVVQNKNSCVEIQHKSMHLTVHPFHLNDFNGSLKEILSRRITRYCKELGGILLGHDNITLLSNAGVINYDNCFVHLDIEGDFFVFKPIIGHKLKGTVNKKSNSHLGCLVYNLFNVALPKPEDDECWLGNNASNGQEILFQITETNLERKLPYIRGEIISMVSDSDSGISTGEENKCNTIVKFHDTSSDEENDKVIKKSGKKKKHKKENSNFDDNYGNDEAPVIKKLQETSDEEADKVIKKSAKKKKHKKQSSGVDESYGTETESPMNSVRKLHRASYNNEDTPTVMEKKSKKKRKRKLCMDSDEEKLVVKKEKHLFSNAEDSVSEDDKKYHKLDNKASLDDSIKKQKRKRRKISETF